MPAARRTKRPPRGVGGEGSASLLAQCARCGAIMTAFLTRRGPVGYLPLDRGRHRNCGGRFRLFRTNKGAASVSGSDWCAGFRMSSHALQRQREMKISDAELARCLSKPEQVYSALNYGPNRKVYQEGRLAVPVNVARGEVITVLWRTDEEYKRGG